MARRGGPRLILDFGNRDRVAPLRIVPLHVRPRSCPPDPVNDHGEGKQQAEQSSEGSHWASLPFAEERVLSFS